MIGATVGFGEEAGTAFVVTSACALEMVGFAMEPTGVKATAEESINIGTIFRKTGVTYLEGHTRH